MIECSHDCDENDPSNYAPDSAHFLDCPVWQTLYNYTHDTVKDILP